MDDIKAALERMIYQIEEAHACVNAGQMVNFPMLEHEVGAVCERALAQPPANARGLQPLIATLISKLDALAIALQDYKERVAGEGI